METKTELLLENCYHIYNHANGEDNLFRNDENYRYFLGKYKEYLSGIFETYAYCLMPNHFHLLIKIQNMETICNYYQQHKKIDISQDANKAQIVDKFVIQQLSNFFNAYAKAYNKQYKRRGAVFCGNFKRKCVNDTDYFANLLRYIHRNPIKHGFVDDILDWKYSSFQNYVLEKAGGLNIQEGLNLFANIEEFKQFHSAKGGNINRTLDVDDF